MAEKEIVCVVFIKKPGWKIVIIFLEKLDGSPTWKKVFQQRANWQERLNLNTNREKKRSKQEKTNQYKQRKEKKKTRKDKSIQTEQRKGLTKSETLEEAYMSIMAAAEKNTFFHIR